MNQKIIDSIGYEKKFTNQKDLQEEIIEFNKRIIRLGFINYQSRFKIKDSLHIYIVNFKNRIERLQIHIPDSIQKELPEHLKDKKLFEIPFNQTEIFLNELNEEIANQGKPFNSLQLKKINILNQNTAEATLTINKTQQRTLDKIIIKGYDKFPKSYLKNFLNLKTGKTFNKKLIDKKLNELSEIDFARSTREPEVLFTKDSTTLYLYSEKRNSNNFDGFLGFSNEENSNNLTLNGYINVNLNNNLNFGESLNIEYKNNGEEFSYFFAKTKLPFLFNTPISPEASLSITNQDSTFTTNQQTIGLNYQVSPKINIKTSYLYENSNFIQEDNTTTVNTNEDYKASFWNIELSYKKRSQYKIFQYNTNTSINLGTGNRKTPSTNNQQQRIQLDAEKIFSLNYRNHIYIANHSGFINSNNYIDNELFRTGGINTLRGFQENSLVGELFSFFNTEYRYLLDQNLYVNNIFDFGRIENKNQNLKNTVYSFGFGIGLETKSGLLKLIFANGKTEQQNFEFRNTKVHLSLTTIF